MPSRIFIKCPECSQSHYYGIKDLHWDSDRDGEVTDAWVNCKDCDTPFGEGKDLQPLIEEMPEGEYYENVEC